MPNRRVAFLVAAGVAAWSWSIARPASAQNLDPINLALNKPARQSSTYSGDAGLAVDGNSDGWYWNGSVTHTLNDQHSWWEVDLGEVRQLGRVEIANRTDCCGERLIPFVVIVADIPIIDTDITDADENMYPGIFRTTVSGLIQARYSIPINRSGRYVRIGLVGDNLNPLSLAEVKVIEADNAARGRQATQSSNYPGSDASRAVDGNVSGVFSSGSVAVTTQNEWFPWWYVDLGMDHDIREIHVWSGNVDCCTNRDPRPKFVYRLSNVPFTPANSSWVDTGTGSSILGPVEIVNGIATVVPVAHASPAVVPVNARGRYLAIQLVGGDYLSLSEVQVWTMARGSVGAHARLSSPAASSTENLAIDFKANSAPAVTQSQDQPYWEADLGGIRYLETLKLWSEPGDTSLNTFYVFVSNGEFKNASGANITTIDALKAAPGVSWWVGRGPFQWVTSPVTATAIRRQGRFVRVMAPGTQTLKLREAEIVTTDGIAMATSTSYNGLPHNRNNGSAESSSAFVDEYFRTLTLTGYFPRPSTSLSFYAFNPNTSGSGGTYSLFASGTTGTTPVLTGYSAAPMYGFVTVNAIFPASSWTTGNVAGLLVQAADDSGFTTTPLRGIDDDGSEHVFWPDIRFLSGSNEPTNPYPAYLNQPMGTYPAASGYPNGAIPSTRTAFMNTYGYSAQPTHAKYYNQVDLGLGRDMYCKTQAPWRTCMVDNWAALTTEGSFTPIFGIYSGPIGATGPNAKLGATVVMVASTTSPSSPPVFGAYDRNGNRIDSIALGNGGNKTIPHNCMACHGGSGNGSDASGKPKVNRAAFLPFDTSTFLDLGTPTVASQSEAFRQLNAFVLSTQPTPAITDLINGWYGGLVNSPNHSLNANYVPAGWKNNVGQTKAYNKVIKPHCRGCHIAQQASEGGFDFLKAADADALRALIISDVCVAHRMPHAQQTLKRFMADGSRATLLGYFGRNDVGTVCK